MHIHRYFLVDFADASKCSDMPRADYKQYQRTQLASEDMTRVEVRLDWDA